MEILMQIGAVYIIVNGLAFFYFHQRLNAQDKYLTTYLQSFASHKDILSPPVLETSQIMNDNSVSEKKPEVYSPRFDQDAIMSGKVIDPFD